MANEIIAIIVSSVSMGSILPHFMDYFAIIDISLALMITWHPSSVKVGELHSRIILSSK